MEFHGHESISTCKLRPDYESEPRSLYFAALPVPDSDTLCGEPTTSSSIIRLPFCGVVSVGLKVTDTLQLLPGFRVLSHCDFTTNTDGDALSICILTDKVFFLPAFLIFTVLAALVPPTIVVSPNARECGLIVSF